jgi:hypothetical protein
VGFECPHRRHDVRSGGRGSKRCSDVGCWRRGSRACPPVVVSRSGARGMAAVAARHRRVAATVESS